MAQVLEALKAIREDQARLAAEVESISNRLDALAPSAHDTALPSSSKSFSTPTSSVTTSSQSLPTPAQRDAESSPEESSAVTASQKPGSFTSRIILT